MNLHSINLNLNKKRRAQAMVEFMLTLPLLLVLIYGIIEVARVIFIFSSVANASREAVRYGSAAGELNNTFFYQDCDGIRAVANESAILTDFDQINITYDRGVKPDGTQIPISGVDPDPYKDSCPIDGATIRNGDRIIVQISASYKPIIPIIPIEPIKIVSASARTFLISIPVLGSALPTGFAAESPTPSRTPFQTATLTSTSTVTLVYTSTNTAGATSTQSNFTPGPPTLTFTPSLTSIPTNSPLPTSSPTISPTPISCSGLTGVSHGPLTFPDKLNRMEMRVTNNSGYTLATSNIYVEWNHDSGHAGGSDPTLQLKKIVFANQPWDVNLNMPSTYISGYFPLIPPGESTIQFFFDQSYDVRDGTERIIITIGTPGCINYPVDSRN
jgi:TadE-like protein